MTLIGVHEMHGRVCYQATHVYVAATYMYMCTSFINVLIRHACASGADACCIHVIMCNTCTFLWLR